MAMTMLTALGLMTAGLTATAASSMVQRNAAKEDRRWQEEQAQKQMDFQREMSDTSWQRGVADMEKAGLNPALAYSQGGASSAVGAMPSSDGGYQRAMERSQQLMYNLASTAIIMQGFGNRAPVNFGNMRAPARISNRSNSAWILSSPRRR